ncbi:hypothetical protein BGW41_007481 [Actinomortierella wolfii]|nr:hypothetical protein BGW41_007481 [Actinomortierella wolfii]
MKGTFLSPPLLAISLFVHAVLASASESNGNIKFELQANVVSCGADPSGGSSSNSEPHTLCTSPESKLFSNIVFIEGTPNPGATGVRGRLYDVGTLCDAKITGKIDRAWIAFLDCVGCPLATKMANLEHTNPQAVLLYNQSQCDFTRASPLTHSTPSAAPGTSLPLAPDSTATPAAPPASDPAQKTSPPPQPSGSDQETSPPSSPQTEEPAQSHPSEGGFPEDHHEPDKNEEDDKSAKPLSRRRLPQFLYSHAPRAPSQTHGSAHGQSSSNANSSNTYTNTSINISSSSNKDNSLSSTMASLPPFFESTITVAMADQVAVNYLFKVLLGPASTAPLPAALSALKTRAAEAASHGDNNGATIKTITDLMISISPAVIVPTPSDDKVLSMSKPIFVGVAIIVGLMIAYVLVAFVARPLYRRYKHHKEGGDETLQFSGDRESGHIRRDLEGGGGDGGQNNGQSREIHTSDWKALNMFPTSNFGSLQRSQGSSTLAPEHDREKEMTEVGGFTQSNEKTCMDADNERIHSEMPEWDRQQQEDRPIQSDVGGMMAATFDDERHNKEDYHAQGIEDHYAANYDTFLQQSNSSNMIDINSVGEGEASAHHFTYDNTEPIHNTYRDYAENTAVSRRQSIDREINIVHGWQKESLIDNSEASCSTQKDQDHQGKHFVAMASMAAMQPTICNTREKGPSHTRHGSDLFGWGDQSYRRSLDLKEEENTHIHRKPTTSSVTSLPTIRRHLGNSSLRRPHGLASSLRHSLERGQPINQMFESQTESKSDLHTAFVERGNSSAVTAEPITTDTTVHPGNISSPVLPFCADSATPQSSIQEDRFTLSRGSGSSGRQTSQLNNRCWSTSTSGTTTAVSTRASFADDFARPSSLDGFFTPSTIPPSSFRASLDQARPGKRSSPLSSHTGLFDTSGVAEGVTTKIDIAELLRQEEEIANAETDMSATINSVGQVEDSIVHAPVPIVPTSSNCPTIAQGLSDRVNQKKPFRAHAVKPDPIQTRIGTSTGTSNNESYEKNDNTEIFTTSNYKIFSGNNRAST